MWLDKNLIDKTFVQLNKQRRLIIDTDGYVFCALDRIVAVINSKQNHLDPMRVENCL